MQERQAAWWRQAEQVWERLYQLKLHAWEEQDCELFKVYYRAERDLRRLLEAIRDVQSEA